MRLLAILVFALLASTASAQLFSSICPGLFQSSSTTIYSLLANNAQSGLISISLLIVILVLAVLGIVYAFGTAFGLDSLKKFTVTELAESVFNIVIIAFVATGVSFAGGAVAFITGLGALGTSQFGTSPPAIDSAQTLYLSLCNSYINNGLESMIPAITSASVAQTLFGVIQSFSLKFEPGGLGFAFSPYAGIAPLTGLIGTQIDVFFVIAGFFVAIPIFLYLIYFLFPYFLYAGVLLRSFPWTRAAGGTLLALFISFYIVFPSILYPFSTYQPTLFQGFAIGLGQAGTLTLFSLSAILGAFPLVGFFTVGEINNFAYVVGNLALQALGLVMALVITFDLVEAFGDLLGAPSLERDMLTKVI